MNSKKDLAYTGMFTAILIAGQFALSAISGVEIVTVLFLTFSYVFGIKNSLFVANAFSILRCFIFGFIPNVLLLYLVYYNIFALIIGAIGKAFKRRYSIKNHILLIVVAALLTVGFTALDNLITPLYYGFTIEATKAYAYYSLTAIIPQTACAILSVSLLFYPLYKVFIRTTLSR